MSLRLRGAEGKSGNNSGKAPNGSAGLGKARGAGFGKARGVGLGKARGVGLGKERCAGLGKARGAGRDIDLAKVSRNCFICALDL